MTRWRLRHPLGIDEEVARWTLDQPPQLRALRSALQQAVLSSPMPDIVDLTDLTDLAERLVIVATELAGNALRHGRPPTVVALLRADGHLILDVLDHDVDTRPDLIEQRPSGAGGLGLHVAERLAQDVGWYPIQTGKHVWASFTIPGS